MIITINGENIDFSLENEKSIEDVIFAIDSWLRESGMTIIKLFVNGDDLSDSELNIPLSAVSDIEIETDTLINIKINNLSHALTFIEEFLLKLNNRDIHEPGLRNDLKTVVSHLPSLLSMDYKNPDSTVKRMIEENIDKANLFDNPVEDEVKSLYNNLSSIELLLRERLNEFSNPMNELKNSLNMMLGYGEELENVSLYLQTGKEVEAGKIMTSFISLFQKVLRLLHLVMISNENLDRDELNGCFEEFNDILKELVQGYESQDIVLIGDILEYEITPKIEDLNKIIC